MAASKQKGNHHPPGRQSGAFFGRRKAKPLSPRRQALYDRLLPILRIDADADQVELAHLFDRQPEGFVLEIGFGGGEHLCAQAIRHPQLGFIGAEPFINGVAKLLVSIERDNIANIRIFDFDATILLAKLPSNAFERVDLLYPDPWPKKRHWKRRFVNAGNLRQIARILRPGGEFRFASDIDNYVNWTLRLAAAEPLLQWTARDARDWKMAWPDWQRTRYEQKAIHQGRLPTYLRFEKPV